MKKCISCFMGVVICFCFTILSITSVKAAVVSNDIVYLLYNSSSRTYSVQAYFEPSHTVVAGEGYNLTVGKNVKQAYVRAQSDGCTLLFIQICGSYDSGRSYSKTASSTYTSNIICTPCETVKNCGTCMQRLSYGWIYF